MIYLFYGEWYGKITSTSIASKVRTDPVCKLILPKFELLSTLINTKTKMGDISKYFKQNLYPIPWLYSIAHKVVRLTKIDRLSRKNQSLKTLKDNYNWCHRPRRIMRNKKHWPISKIVKCHEDETEKEYKTAHSCSTGIATNPLFNTLKFGNFNKLLQVYMF